MTKGYPEEAQVTAKPIDDAMREGGKDPDAGLTAEQIAARHSGGQKAKTSKET